MGAWEWFVFFSICGLIVATVTAWSRSGDSQAYRATWIDSTASTEDDAQIAEERATFDQIIAAEFPAGIPHQRSKEDDQ